MPRSNDSALRLSPETLLRWAGWACLAGLFVGIAIGTTALLNG
jgi:hypothetical protein